LKVSNTDSDPCSIVTTEEYPNYTSSSTYALIPGSMDPPPPRGKVRPRLVHPNEQLLFNNVSLNINANASLRHNVSEINFTIGSTQSTADMAPSTVSGSSSTVVESPPLLDFKKEPIDDFQSVGADQGPDSLPDSIGLDDFSDDFSEFLSNIVEDEEFTPEFLRDLSQVGAVVHCTDLLLIVLILY